MKINLESLDKEQFIVNQSTYSYGVVVEEVFLIQPQHIGCKWTQENKVFRSSLWNVNGKPVSLSFPKFVNWGEQPEIFPIPKSLKGCVAVEKIDGSTLIISKYKGKTILRTRGTFDAHGHDNGKELDLLFKRYPKIKEYLDKESETMDHSILLEWVSPINRIILNYGEEPDWYLVGVVNHEDYSLVTQEDLDEIAKILEIKRPQTHTFESIEDLIKNVEEWKGKEGVCLYSNNGQTIHKVKGLWYLQLHSLKSEISNIEKLVDVYLEWGMPVYEDFEKKIVEIFDYELFTQVRSDISKICDAYKEVTKIIEHMREFVSKLKGSSRKDQALSIIGSYGQTCKKAIAFNLLDGKELDKKSWKTLLMQALGKG